MLPDDSLASTGKTTLRQEFDRLFLRCSVRAYSLAYRLLGNRDDAEDAVQDAFIRAWRHFDQYDRGRPFESWLFRILCNVAADLERSRRRARAYSLDRPADLGDDNSALSSLRASPAAQPETAVLSRLFSEPVERALASLPAIYRHAVVLADVQGVAYQDIAASEGCPVGTVRSRVHRGRLMIRHYIDAHVGDRASQLLGPAAGMRTLARQRAARAAAPAVDGAQ